MATNNQKKQAVVPELRFPEFRESGEWQLKEIQDFLAQSRIPSDQNDPTRRITVRLHLQGVEHREYRGTESVKSANNFIRNSGQFIYGKQNIHKGAFGIIPSHLDGFETSGDLPCFDFKSCCVPKWLMYHISREEIYRHLEFNMKGTGSKRLNERTFLTLPISAPAQKEQKKIADCLGSLDDLIAAHSRKLAALQDHKKGLLQQLFPAEGETTPKLRFPEFDGEWRLVKLKPDLLEKVIDNRGKTPPISDSGYPLVEVNALGSSEIDYNKVTKYVDTDTYENWFRGHVRSSDILFSTVGAIAETSMVCNRDNPVIAQNIVGLRVREAFLPNFVLYLLSSTANKNKFLRITMGAVQPSLKVSQMVELSFFVPKKAEQHKIADCLSDLESLITAQTEQIAALKEHKKGLMQQLFPNPELSKA